MLTILNSEYSHQNTAKLWSSENVDGDSIPWVSYPAIEYLSQLNLKGKCTFELSSGKFSFFFAKRGFHIISIVSDQEWFNKIQPDLLPNQELYLKSDNVVEYVNSIRSSESKFDIIIIDGLLRHGCAQEAVHHLSEYGMIILDNYDWYKNT